MTYTSSWSPAADAGTSPAYASASSTYIASLPRNELAGGSTEPADARQMSAWIALSLSKAETASALQSASLGVGSFCVRAGTKGDVLCVLLTATHVGHFRIVVAPGGGFELPDVETCAGLSFGTFSAVLAHFQANPINNRLKVMLTRWAPAPAPSLTSSEA